MSVLPRTVPTKQLAQNLASAGVTMYLNNTLDWDGNQLSSADFGTIVYAVLRNASNSQIELIAIDPTTITAAAAITITKRALGYNGGTTAATETAYDWLAGDTFVELGSDSPQFLNQFANVGNDNAFTGANSFAQVPSTTGGNPVAGNDLVRKTYVDGLLAGIASTISLIVSGTAGETVAAGQLVYLKASDGRWWLADADLPLTVNNVVLGMAQGAGAAAGAIASGVMLQGLDTNQVGLTPSTVYYASNTAGGISSSVGTNEVTVGIAKTATTFYFNPRFNQQLTEDEQDAIVGDNGTPSATNKFVTQSGLQLGAEVYAADAVGTDSYAITLSPAIAAYAAGQKFLIKLGTANTGAATLNVNAVGAKAIKKNYNADLVTGDLLANQVIQVAYDAVNDVFQLISPVSGGVSRAVVTDSYDISTASGNKVIAHNLGKVPTYVRITTHVGFAATVQAHSDGAWDGTRTRAVWWMFNTAGTNRNGQDTSNIVVIDLNNGSDTQKATITVDGTNVTLAFTKAGTPTGTAYFVVETIAN